MFKIFIFTVYIYIYFFLLLLPYQLDTLLVFSNLLLIYCIVLLLFKTHWILFNCLLLKTLCNQNLNDTFINLGLTNVLVFWHPLFLGLVFLYIFNSLKKKFFFLVYFDKSQNYKLLLGFCIITFCLGSYWSAQELLWGGFWNWDFVELTLLLLMLHHISFQHFKIKYPFFFNIIIFIKTFFLVFVFYVYFNRTTLILSQHSFASSYFFFIDIKIFTMSFIFFTFFFLKFNKNIFFKKKYLFIFSLFQVLILIILYNLFFKFFLPIVINKLFIKFVFLFFVCYFSVYFWKFWIFSSNSLFTLIYFFNYLVLYSPFFNKKVKFVHNCSIFLVLFILCFFFSYIPNFYFGLEKKYEFVLKYNNFIYSSDFFWYILKLLDNFSQLINFKLNFLPQFIYFENQLINLFGKTLYCLTISLSNFICIYLWSKLVVFIKTKI